MNKEEKEIIAHLVKKELSWLKKEKIKIEFPKLRFLKSLDSYEEKLKLLKKKLI